MVLGIQKLKKKYTAKQLLFWLIALTLLTTNIQVSAQLLNHKKSDKLDLIYVGNRYSYLMPHISQTFENAMDFHRGFWNYNDISTSVLLNDFEDSGHAGAIAMPFSMVQIGIEPYGFAFSIIPSNERFQWLFNHELTHITMTDKANKKDRAFRKFLQGKVSVDNEKPVSALWSYYSVPRWYSPRWFHEGIACFMETWMSGGMGRAMGTYDEMYFRSIVNENEPIYSVVGLETEGTTIDFQVGANSYLYGARFITYLANHYGMDKLKAFYTRTDDSKAFYAKQFKKVYNQSVQDVWSDWTEFEYQFQNDNINRIKEYPLTPFQALTEKPLGSVSKYCYNPATQKIYAAVNHPGAISQIAEIDKNTGRIRKIATLDSPSLYFTAHLAYNPQKEKIYISEHNSKYRNLVEVDIKSGKKKTLIKFTRTGDLVFNPADESLWGVRNDNGYSILVHIPAPYTNVVQINTAPFGKTFFDLAISPAGDILTASLSGVKGEQSIVLFNLKEIEQGITSFKTVYELEDNTLTQFKFSADGQSLIGSSYYTGVSNIWRVKLDGAEFELLSNTETGFFMPLQLNNDSLIVLKFYRDGMVPGVIPIQVLEDANAINYLGNQVHHKHPEVEQWTLPVASGIKNNSEVVVEESYIPVRNMKLTNAFPDIAGFKETIALGYHLNWSDPIGLSRIGIFVAGSPWSNNPNKQKIHAMFDWNLWNWHFLAAYNKTHFYDLFGPTKRSRAGYSLGIGYKKSFANKSPFKTYYEFGAYHYGGLEVLPQYQNISSPIKSFQAATASYGLSKLRKTLGGVVDEKGYSWDISATSYLAEGDLYPSVVSNQDIGFLIPHMRNTSFWVRNSIGQSFGNRNSGMSHFYFGGFRNNYVDWQPSEQYRKTLAFAGAEIDEIQAYNYIKTMGELNLRPLRLRNVGTSWLYPTYIKTALFGTHLMANFDKTGQLSHTYNIGAQIDIQLVLFSYMKTTWSVGYARKMEKDKINSDKIMLSLKLLGN